MKINKNLLYGVAVAGVVGFIVLALLAIIVDMICYCGSPVMWVGIFLLAVGQLSLFMSLFVPPPPQKIEKDTQSAVRAYNSIPKDKRPVGALKARTKYVWDKFNNEPVERNDKSD